MARNTTRVMPKPAALAVKPGDNPPASEVLAQAIVDLAAAAKALTASRLSDKTLLLLLSHASGVSQRDIKAVLSAMQSLESQYLKPNRATAHGRS